MFLIQKLKYQYKALMTRAFIIRTECKQYEKYKPEGFESSKILALDYIQAFKKANSSAWGRFKTLIPFTANYRLARQLNSALNDFDKALTHLEQNIQQYQKSIALTTRPRSQSVDAELPRKIIPFNNKNGDSVDSFFAKKTDLHDESIGQPCKFGFYA